MSTTLSPADAVWYLGENDRNTVTVSGVIWLDRPLDPDRLRTVLAERLVARFPAFSQRVVRARVPGLMPHWEDDPDFDLDHHLEIDELPAPGDLAALQDLCSAQRSTRLDPDRPLWKVHLIQGYGGRSAIHARLHHTIGDGWTLVRLLLTLVDRDPDAEPVPVEVDGGSAHGPLGTVLRLASSAPLSVVHPRRTARQVRAAADDVAWGTRFLLAPPRPAVTSLIGKPSGEKRMVWDDTGIPVDQIKAVGRPHGATVNDVLCAALAGALRRHLLAHGDHADDVLMLAPISLRHAGEPLHRRLGNRIGLLPILLPVDRDTPLERLAAVRDRMSSLKGSPGPLVSWALLTGTALLTPPVERAIHAYNQARSTGVVTNVPGPAEPVYLAGARVEGLLGWGGMTANLNLNWAFFSLAGTVYTGAITDTGITPDPGALLAAFREEWQALAASAAH